MALDCNIVLIGFMGAGKSAVSAYLGTHYKMNIAEMDQMIEKQEGMIISDIFKKYGESYFRDKETELLKRLQEERNTVISCGGGIVLRKENIAEMKKNGKVFLLTASPEAIYERVKDDDRRPVLAGRKNVEGIRKLMDERREKYIEAADIVIDTSHKRIPEVCRELMKYV